MGNRRVEYNKLKKVHEEEEDKLQAQIKGLQMELEEKRLENRMREGVIERDLSDQMSKIEDLKQSIQNKEEEFSDPMVTRKTSVSSSFSPSAPAVLYESIYSSQSQPSTEDSLASPSSTQPSLNSSLGKSMDCLATSASPGTRRTRTPGNRRKYER